MSSTSPLKLLQVKKQLEKSLREDSSPFEQATSVRGVGLDSEGIVLYVSADASPELFPSEFEGCQLKIALAEDKAPAKHEILKQDSTARLIQSSSVREQTGTELHDCASLDKIAEAVYNGVLASLEDVVMLEILYESLYGESIYWDEEFEVFSFFDPDEEEDEI